ncbi:MAG TPA: hypothetical protein VGI74_02255 [Streptosporangiaceae bacterium]|jgi:membrane protein implicated in regulation of membrane protease activity
MRWFKVAAIAVGVLIAFLVVSSVIGFLLEAVIAALVVAVIVLGIKAVSHNKQVSSERSDREVYEPAYKSPLGRQKMPNTDDELARLKREMGG